MKIIFEKDRWIKDDLLSFVDRVGYDDYEEQFFNKIGIYPDKNVVKLVNKLKKHFDLDQMGLHYMKDELFRYTVLNIITEETLRVKNIEEIPIVIKNMCDEEIFQKIIKDLCINNNQEFLDEDSEIDRSNLDDVKEIVNKLDIDPKVKWQIFKFIINPEELFTKISDGLSKILPIYIKEMKKHQKEIDSINEHIKERIEVEGTEFYAELLSGEVSLKDYENIYVRSSYIHAESMIPTTLKKDVYLRVGFKLRESIKLVRGIDDQEHMLNSIRMITDSMKFKIIEHTKENAIFGKELCELTGLSIAALSYHTTQLVNMGLLSYEKRGNKIYYSSRKVKIVEVVEKFLENIK